MIVKPVNPVAQRLPVHAADPRRFAPVHPVNNRRKRQKAPALAHGLRRSGQPPKLLGRKIRS
jgi:hypothetical protein